MKELNINGAVMKCYPLCAAQRLHYYTIKFCPTQVLCIGTGLYVQQEVDFDLLKKAIYKAYEMFETMRLRFAADEEGEVYQYITPFEEREIRFADFSHWKEEDAHDEMRKWTAIPFERYNSPMNEVVMIKLPDGFSGIYLKVDHMTMDSSSIIGFNRAVLEIYCAYRYGTEMPSVNMQSYIKQLEKDLAYEEGSPARQKDEEFWKNTIAESEPMYTDFAGQGRLLTQRRENNNPNQRCAMVISKSPVASISVFPLEKDSSMRLMKFCELYNVPMASLLLMGLRTVLSKFNDNEKDVSVKTCIARRGTLSEKYCGGTRIHFFPLRTVMEPEMTFLDGVKMIQAEQNKIFRHANFDPIAVNTMRAQHWQNIRGTSYESISLTYQPLSMKKGTKEMPDIPYKSMWYTNGVAGQPLYLTVMHRPEDNGLNFNFEYRVDAVTEYEMEYFYYYLCRVLFRGIEDENRTIAEILEMI
ncbi:MAG: condensation domain-containing protein [Ruminococcus sp.]|nr:condensation domain-containing protein [Ruminococcus sp.]MCM1381868.1 condensation domain-containing protein [Muribaculaceae bacterium]MCM1478738.1 condensation domain-containing protein [Muribaculaceae bacterium]